MNQEWPVFLWLLLRRTPLFPNFPNFNWYSCLWEILLEVNHCQGVSLTSLEPCRFSPHRYFITTASQAKKSHYYSTQLDFLSYIYKHGFSTTWTCILECTQQGMTFKMIYDGIEQMYFKVEKFWQQHVSSPIKSHSVLFCFLIVTIIKYYGLGYTDPSCNGIRKQNLFLALQYILYSDRYSNVHC